MRRPRPALLVALAALAVFAVACGDDDDAGGGRLNVVTTVAPITSLAENIGGARIELHGLVPEGTNSHTYEPPVSDVTLIADADLIIINGLDLEEPTKELAESNKKGSARLIELGDLTIDESEYRYDFSFPESDGHPNPHLWPNPGLTKEYASHIRDAFVEADAVNADYFNANYDLLAQRLDDLAAAMEVAAATVPEENRKLLTYHDSWAYWAPDYGFEVIGAIQPSNFAEPSAQEVAGLIDQIKDEGIPAIFGSEVFPSDVLETIADETGAEYVDDLRDDDLPGEPGDALHSYIGLMVTNMKIMIPALGGDASAMDAVNTSLVFADGDSDADYPQ
jgi:ABC-type Zn uptake system ZnuABC Zn-binding protein ZnuA